MGSRVVDMLGGATQVLVGEAEIEPIRIAHDRIRERSADLSDGLIRTIAREAPVAADLRLVHGMLVANLHVERMGDLAVRVARVPAEVETTWRDEQVLSHLLEMGRHAQRVGLRALEVFARRDREGVDEVVAMDDPLDRLHDTLFDRLLDIGHEHRGWALRMVVAARALERFGDHAVEIALQVPFVVGKR